MYRGDIPHSQWVDAQYLKTGYRLLNPDNTWAIVTSVQVTDEPLTAYNLTVADYHTYFVAGQQHAPAVWVHNNCWEALPNGHKYLHKLSEGLSEFIEVFRCVGCHDFQHGE